MRPSPFELWQQAGGDAAEYRRLMREHGHLVPGTSQPLPCGWPGHRADDEDSRAGGTTSASGPGPDGAQVEPLAPARPATVAAVPVGGRGTVPGGDAGPHLMPRPGHSSACPGQAEDAGPSPSLLGGGPALAPVSDATGLGATGAGITPDRAAPPPTHALSGPGTAGAARSSAAAPAAGLSGQAARDEWKRAESAKNAGLRRGRSRGRQQPGYRPGGNRRGGGGDAA